MKKLLFFYFLTILLIILFSSCRSVRGYESNTHQFIGYGTYKAPNVKGLDK